MKFFLLFAAVSTLIVSACGVSTSTSTQAENGRDGRDSSSEAINVAINDSCSVRFVDITETKFIVEAIGANHPIEWIVKRDGEQSDSPDPYSGIEYSWDYSWIAEQGSDVESITFTSSGCRDRAVFMLIDDQWTGKTVISN